ncbi:MAG: DUF4097 domain-containing protein [Kangiellaceae bacterium]|nr:DUF4097 domain-containing protein [Kangiellaceae bacterium]
MKNTKISSHPKSLLIAGIAILLPYGPTVNAASLNYKETKTLTLDASSLNQLRIDAAAGFLIIEGSSSSTIELTADIEAYSEDIELSLEKNGKSAVLLADANKTNKSNWMGDSPKIDLTLKIPKHLSLKIKDGSGSIKIRNTGNNINLNDGSGSIEISHIVGNIEIDDGSGSTKIDHVAGNVLIDDGSGSITIKNIEGSVNIEDGSGSMDLLDIEGLVTIDDASGSINVKRLSNGLTIINEGSGSLNMTDVKGSVTME